MDSDLEKFFNNVPQDKLISLVHKIINDGDTEIPESRGDDRRQIRENRQGNPTGRKSVTTAVECHAERIGQGGGKQRVRFIRYAVDCVIAVKGEASAKRVMYLIADWIERKLRLKVNVEKTLITRPRNLKYLGFSFWKETKSKEWKRRPH